MSKRRDAPLSEYYTVEQATTELSVSRSTLYRLFARLGIVPVKAANVSLFTREDIERMKQEREAEE